MLVRAAVAADLAAVVELERGAEGAPHWSVGEYEAIVCGRSAAARCLLVAEDEGSVVGFAVGKTVAGIGEIENVVVAGKRRGGGVGRRLCEGVIGWARSAGARQIELEVREGNGAAIAVYRRLGFVEMGRRVGYYGNPKEDALLMGMRLGGMEN